MRATGKVLRCLVACSVLVACGSTAARGETRATANAGGVAKVNGVAITVGDLNRAIAFYTSVLGFELLDKKEVAGGDYERLFGVFGARIKVARLSVGTEIVELFQFAAPAGREMPLTRSNDRWFRHIAIIVRDMDEAYAHLIKHGVQGASTAPQTLPRWNPNAGGIKAYYFRDPDGHFLELLWFPPGKGDARWQANQRLFLGVDHSAIVVEDTDASLALYRDALGFNVAGGSENYGIEQERLNNVFGARLRITTLTPPDGVKVELLEYLAPRDGQPMPRDSKANDLWHWHIQFRTRDFVATSDTVRARKAHWISPGTIEVPDRALGFRRAFSFRDPDGHALFLVE